MHRGYKTELDPNNKQKTLLAKNAGAARFAYNYALNRKITAYKNKEKVPSARDINKEIVILKHGELSWLREVSKWSPQEALRNCDTAFKNFFRNCKQNKKGKKGFPKFKSKKNRLGSFRLYYIRVSNSHIQLPRLGKIKLKERGYLPDNKKIINATVSEHAGRWFVSILVEEEMIPSVKPESIIGVDLGIKTLAVTSKNETFENHKVLRSNLKKLQRKCRQLSKKVKGSKNRAKARKKLAKLHYKISCIRKNTINKITTHLTKTNSVIVIEDLNISGILKNRKLSRAIADLGLYEFKRQLEYKGKWYNCKIIIADRFFPSSKTCSCCKNVKQDLTLADRIYICNNCGIKIDRDLNAAINLRNIYTVSSTEIQAFGDGSAGSQCVNETAVCELGTKQQCA